MLMDLPANYLLSIDQGFFFWAWELHLVLVTVRCNYAEL